MQGYVSKSMDEMKKDLMVLADMMSAGMDTKIDNHLRKDGYRICVIEPHHSVTPKTGSYVIVQSLEGSGVESDMEGRYNSVDDLPAWMQERLAILMLMSPKPPTEHVQGVGRRISQYIFWIYE